MGTERRVQPSPGVISGDCNPTRHRTSRMSFMNVRHWSSGLFTVLLALPAMARDAHEEVELPNLIFVLADDLGYGDLGCYGQEKIKTPHLDRMANEGLRFTQFYAGSTVCAPSRSVLMTGQHLGHTWVRGNGGAGIQTLRDEDVTVAEVFKRAGYATALMGKWGLGELDTAGHPNEQGFDDFYGYLSQSHAHNYYPTFLIRNSERVELRNVPADHPKANKPSGAGWAKERVDYSHDLIGAEALKWIREHRDGPFFLYWSLTIPHANNEGSGGTGDGQEVPDHGIYADEDWSSPNKGQAAMISRMDRDIGRLFDLLKELEIDENTLVIFSSDNGHHREGGNDPEFFDANGPLRGMKRDLYEGGIRVPTLARWPGTIAPGRVSDHVGYFGDLMATACELVGVEAAKGLDSLSFLPTLRGDDEAQAHHDYLYWEFYERGSKQAVRFGDWKAVRAPMFAGQVELFDLSQDLAESHDLSSERPELVKRAVDLMGAAHTPNPNWKVRAKR